VQFMCCLSVSIFVCIFGRFDVLRAFFKVSFLFFIRKLDSGYVQFPYGFASLFSPLPGSA